MMGKDERGARPPPVPETVASVPYRVYCSDERRSQLEQTEWIIRGTDGQWYAVPAQPGGWLQRAEHQGGT